MVQVHYVIFLGPQWPAGQLNEGMIWVNSSGCCQPRNCYFDRANRSTFSRLFQFPPRGSCSHFPEFIEAFRIRDEVFPLRRLAAQNSSVPRLSLRLAGKLQMSHLANALSTWALLDARSKVLKRYMKNICPPKHTCLS